MSIHKRKGERVFDSSHDNSHPAPGGNLVLRNEGTAWYCGETYYRDGYAPQSAVKPDPTESARLPLGTRVVVKQGSRGANLDSDWVGKTGTLVEQPRAFTALHDYFAAIDSAAEGAFPLALYADEVEAIPEPTHRHPEGLYRAKDDPDCLVLVKHEAGDGAYEIRYISYAGEDGVPINSGMDDGIVGQYELVPEFPVK